MESEELVQLMKQVTEKGIPWEEVEKKIKVDRKAVEELYRAEIEAIYR